MFDDLDKNALNTTAPAPLTPPASPLGGPAGGGMGAPTPAKTGAEDIFAEVDRGSKPEVFKPKAAVPGAPYATVIPEEHSWKNNKLMIFGLLFGGLFIIVGSGYLALRLLNKNTPAADEAAVQQQQTPLIMPDVAAFANQEVNIPAVLETQPVVTAPLDSDLDGLTDEEEVALGTNANNPDSDLDGLTDREEVMVYNTNPLAADTDSDGYADGEEVKNGFNPNGAGKLYDLNQVPAN